MSSHNYLAGSIFANISATPDSDESTTVIISGRENVNRAIHGDVVAVELLPRSEWKRLGDDKVLDQENDKEEDAKEDEKSMDLDQPEDDESAMQIDTTPLVPTGRVVGIIKKNWRPYCVCHVSLFNIY